MPLPSPQQGRVHELHRHQQPFQEGSEEKIEGQAQCSTSCPSSPFFSANFYGCLEDSEHLARRVRLAAVSEGSPSDHFTQTSLFQDTVLSLDDSSFESNPAISAKIPSTPRGSKPYNTSTLQCAWDYPPLPLPAPITRHLKPLDDRGLTYKVSSISNEAPVDDNGVALLLAHAVCSDPFASSKHRHSKTTVMFDTGATLKALCSLSHAKKLGVNMLRYQNPINILPIDGSSISVELYIPQLHVDFETYSVTLTNVPVMELPSTYDVVLGLPWLQLHNSDIHTSVDANRISLTDSSGRSRVIFCIPPRLELLDGEEEVSFVDFCALSLDVSVQTFLYYSYNRM